MESTLIFDRNKINREQRQALKAAELRLKKTGLLVGEQRNSSSIKPKDKRMRGWGIFHWKVYSLQ